MEHHKDSNYGWIVITLGAFTNVIAVGIPFMCMPVFFNQISKELSLDLVQIGVAWGMGGLASMFASPFGGLLGDRFGTKRILSVVCILSGMAGVLRGFSTGFALFVLTMFIFGFFPNTMVLNIHKSTGIWFSGRKMIIANGIVSTGVALGMMLGAMISGTFISPLVGGWRHALFLYGAGSIVMGILWSRTRREPVRYADNQPTGALSLRHAFIQVLRNKVVWQFGLGHLCYMGCHFGLIGYLPLYLKGLGWAPASADGALAALNAAGMVGAIPLSMFAGRLGLRKGFIIPALLISCISVTLIPVLQGSMVWPLVISFGLMRDSYFAVLMAMVIESRRIGGIYTGTAMGIIFSFANLGTFIAAPVGNRLAVINPVFSFGFWAALVVIAILIYGSIKEDGAKGNQELKLDR